MFYTRLSYDEFIASVNEDIDNRIAEGKSTVVVDVPKEYFDPFMKDVKVAQYAYKLPDDVYDDLHRVELSGWK